MFIDRFIRFLSFEKRYSPHTVVAYQREVTDFADYLATHEIPVDEVGHRHVRSYLANLSEAGRKGSSVNRAISALRTFYKFLLREGLAVHNPMSLVKAMKTPKRLPVVVEESKLCAMLDTSNAFGDDFEGLRDRLVIELLFGTGIRLAELLAVHESDVDSFQRTIRVLGKRSKERLVPMTSTLLAVYKHYVDKKKSSFPDNKPTPLIVTKEGKQGYPKLIYRIVTKYLSMLSVQQKKSPHVLRHTFATALLNKGADLNAIKELLGHAGLAATQVYTHNSVERLKSIYNQAHPKA